MSQENPTDRLTSISDELDGEDNANVGVELLIARKNQRYVNDDDDGSPYQFGFVNTRDQMANHLVTLVTSEVQAVVNDLEDDEEELTTAAYDIANKNRDKDLIQHLSFDDIERSDRFEPVINGTVTEPGSFDTYYDLNFIAIRLRLQSMDTTLVALQTFSKGQVLKTEESLILSTIQEATGSENNEPVYQAEIENTLYQLPYRLDVIYVDDIETVYVFDQQRFERIFDYYDEFRDAAEEVVTELEDMDIPISGMEYIKTGYQHFPNAARLFYDVRELGRYRNLDQDNLAYLYENFSPDPIIREDGEYQIQATDRFDVWGVLRVLNDSHLESPVSNSRYISLSKQATDDDDTT